MVNVNFNLRNPTALVSSLRIILRYDNMRLYYPIKERIAIKHWDQKNQRAKKSYEGQMEFNVRLNSVTTIIENAFRSYLNNNNQQIPTKEDLTHILNKCFGKSIVKDNQLLQVYIRQFIITASSRNNEKTGKPISKSTIQTYKTTLKHISEFEIFKKKVYSFSTIDLEFYDDFKDYLMNVAKLSTNAIGKNFQVLKAILNDATERGINSTTAYKSKRFKVIREESDSIYLTEKEINDFYSYDLTTNSRLETVRDLFVLGCNTGLRFSDYSNIKPQNITSAGDLQIRVAKTDEIITIPILPIVKEILYKYGDILPPAISNQKTNEYLKEIASKIPCFQTNVDKSITKAGRRITLTKQKWELISTHTARRSFATNYYLREFPTLTIMAITGHRTEKAFRKYIKIGQLEQVNLFKSIANKQSNLKAV